MYKLYTREILKRALFLDTSSLILMHNHPSGNIKPSKVDIEVTKQLLQNALLIDITIHDHIIISNKNHYSFKANGLL
ncbi:MAG: JAB domain-containing protein [Rickettsiales endosymbiont of Dermacentor nuttalli]